MKLSQLDPNQILTRQYDEDNNAQRVVIVGSDFSAIQEGINKSLQNFTVNLPQSEQTEKQIFIDRIQIKEIEKQVIIKELEIKEIEKQVIVKEIEYREIEKPIYIQKIEYIDKPIIIEKMKEIPQWVKILLIGQSLILLGIMLGVIFK